MYTSLLPSILSTKKFRGNDVLLTSEAVAEVQMKLHSHLQLLWKFKWHC